jgi:hypothetical protein
MPLLHKYVESSAYYVRTKVKGTIVTFQVTADGLARLQSAGIVVGKPFSRWFLLDLYRSGEAYTGGTGLHEIEASGLAQGELDFTSDPEPETLFPSCSRCASLDDLHLVEVRAEAHYLSILCGACRSTQSDLFDSSVPLPLVTRSLLNRLSTMKGIKESDSSVAAYRGLLSQEFAKKWEALSKSKPVQETLLLDPGRTEGKLL